MAKVPQISRPAGVRPLRLPFQQAGVTGAEFGRLEAEAVESLGQTVEKIGLNIKRQRDANFVLKAEVDASNELRPFLDAPDTGVRSRRGVNAIGGIDATEKFMNDLERKYEDRLENNAQKRAFKNLWLQRKDRTLSSVANHEANQTRVFQDEMTVAVKEGAIKDVQAEPDNQDVIDRAISNVNLVISANAPGSPGEALDLRREKHISDVHETVVLSRLRNNPLFAKEYYDEHKDQIDPGDRPNIEKALDEGLIVQEVGFKVDEITIASKDPKDWINEANKLSGKSDKDREIKKQVLKELNHRIAVNERVRKASEQQAFESELKKIDAGEPWNETAITNPAKRNALKDIERENQKKRVDPNYDTLTVPAKWEKWLATPDDKKAELSLDELTTQYKPHLSTADWNDVVEEWTAERAKIGKASATEKSARKLAEKEVIKFFDSDYKAGIYGDVATKESRTEYLKQIEAFKEWSRLNPDKDPSEYYEQVSDTYKRDWIDGLLKWAVPGREQKPEITPQQKRKELEQETKQRQRAIGVLKDRGVPVTENNIEFVLGQL